MTKTFAMNNAYKILECGKRQGFAKIRVENGFATLRSYDAQISFPTKAESGIYDPEIVIKQKKPIESVLGGAAFERLEKDKNPALFDNDAKTDYSIAFKFDPNDLKFVSNFVSTEATRYYLNGVCFDNESQKMVATDGHKMGFRDFKSNCIEPLKIIIPTQAVELIFGLGVNYIKYCPKTQRIRAESTDGIVIESKTIDGTYPDWTRITKGIEAEPTYKEYKFKISKSDFKFLNTKKNVIIFENPDHDSDVLNFGIYTICDRIFLTGKEIEKGKEFITFALKVISPAVKPDAELTIKIADCNLAAAVNGDAIIMPMRI